MKLFVALCTVLAAASAAPNHGYSFSEVVPTTTHLVSPYSLWGAVSPYAYSAAPLVHAATPLVHAVPAVHTKTQYHVSDLVGQAAYGHVEPGHSHTAVHDGAGNKVGSFSYVKPDGMISRTDYVADAMGYRVASNDLPVAPAFVPAPVVDTPEVVAARAAHLAEVENVKSRARRQVLPASTSPLVHTAVVHHTPVVHTTAVHTPVVHTPVVHTAAVHTPVVHTPVVHTPVVHTPVVHTPVVHTTAVHTPVVHTPVVHSVVGVPHVPADTPEVHAAKVAHFAEHAKARHARAVLPLAYSHAGYPLTTAYTAGAHFLPYSTTYSALHHPYYHHYLGAHHVVV